MSRSDSFTRHAYGAIGLGQPMISVVNGYLCETSCDVAKARHGEDPHPSRTEQADEDGKAASWDPAAVTYGGSLKDRVNPVEGSSAIRPPTNEPPAAPTSLDVLI